MGARSVTWRKFHGESAQMLGATANSLDSDLCMIWYDIIWYIY